MPYSHPQAIDRHTAFKQVRYLLPGAMALAGTAGFINSVALGFFRTPVSHMTGAVSQFGMDSADGRWLDSFATATIILGFLIGAALNGVIVGALRLIPGRSYGVALIVEGALLGLATALLMNQHRMALPAISMACGLQNAMSSSYCGLMIRTTHVTGIVTDIGVMLGHWLRHRQIEGWKVRFLTTVAVSFGAGCWIGQLADVRIGPVCLAFPALGCVLAGSVLWFAYHRGLVDLMPIVEPATPRTSSFPES